MADFFERFRAAPRDADPIGLQMLFFDVPQFDAVAIQLFLQVHPEMSEATCELAAATDAPSLVGLLSSEGPAASQFGLISWGQHTIQMVLCAAPMPYGPVESSVLPALMPVEIKSDAKLHRSHVLLYYAGTHPDFFERYVALAVVAGALARFDAVVIMNEEGRTAVPALDLIPDDDEDILQTLRTLPVPYLYGGFVKLDVGDANRPWARTYTCHRLGLPDFARHLGSHADTSETFRLFAAMLSYARQTGEAFTAGETVDLGAGSPVLLRAPTEQEWYLESPGTMLVVE